jgi:hypothetical protein
MAWYIHTKFHDDRFRYSSNIKGITSTVLEAVVLVLLMRGIYDLLHWAGLRWHDIYIPISMNIATGVQAMLRFCLTNLRVSMFVLLEGGIHYIRSWDGYKCHNIRTKFHEDCNFVITVILTLQMEGIYEWRRWEGLKCHETKFHKDRFRHLKVVGGGIHMQTHREEVDRISLLLIFFFK